MAAREQNLSVVGTLVGGFLLALISVGLIFGAGELVTRYFGGVQYGGWGDPASIRLVSSQMAYNSKGLRDREIPYRRSAGEYRVLCLGDSFTWGQMVPAENAWPKVLERSLAERLPGREVTVINAGRLGWNTADEYAWFLEEGVQYKPDVVLVGFFLNDAEEAHYGIGRLLPEAVEKRLGWSYFYFFLKYRVHLLRSRFGLIESYEEYLRRIYQPDQLGWKKCRRALRLIDEAATDAGAKTAIVVIPAITDWETYPFAEIHTAMTNFADAKSLIAVDCLDAFRSSEHRWTDLRVGPHDEHPSGLGHQIIATVAEEILAEKIGLP